MVNAKLNQSAEEVGEDYFNELLKNNWIDPVNNKNSDVVRECTMDPWVRWLVIFLARKEHFFDMDDTGIPCPSPSKSRRACLLKMSKPLTRLETKSSNLGESKHSSQEGSSKGRSRISLLSVFNVDAEHLNAQDLFLKLKGMKSLVVLQLGRWQTSAEHHIEFVDEDSETLRRVELPERLRYLSLSGISRITELPTSVKNLLHLKVLDLRSCQNLEKLGDEILFLKGLTHLDVSECYMLGHMPNGLGSLLQLEVLKGFMFGSSRSKDPCPLAELTKLKKLKKLSISIGGEAQMLPGEMTKLKEISGLRSLTITWGKLSLTLSDDDKRTLEENWTKLSYPPDLEKLDLRCFPVADIWLEPLSLGSLKKLYIRGGQVVKLDIHNTNESDEMMKVEMVRLKFLHKLTAKWSKLQECFPHLNYLEIHDCPNLQDCPPLDNDEVWIREAIEEQVVSFSMEESMPIPPPASESMPGATVISEPTSAVAATTTAVSSHPPDILDSRLPEVPTVHPPTSNGNVSTSSNIGAASSPTPAPLTSATATDAPTTVTPSLSGALSTTTEVPSHPPASFSLPLSEAHTTTTTPTTDISTSVTSGVATPPHDHVAASTSAPLVTSTAADVVPAVTANPSSTTTAEVPPPPASVIQSPSDATTVSTSTTNLPTNVNTGVPSSTSPENGDTPTLVPPMIGTATDVTQPIIPGLSTTMITTTTDVPSNPPAVYVSCPLSDVPNIPTSANINVASSAPTHVYGDAPASAPLTSSTRTDVVPDVTPKPLSTAATTTPEVPSPPASVIRLPSEVPTVRPPTLDIPSKSMGVSSSAPPDLGDTPTFAPLTTSTVTNVAPSTTNLPPNVNTGVPSSTSPDHGATPTLPSLTTSTVTDVAPIVIPGLLTTVVTATKEVSSHPLSEAPISPPPITKVPTFSDTSVAYSLSTHGSTAFGSLTATLTSTFLTSTVVDSALVSIPDLPSTPTNSSSALSSQSHGLSHDTTATSTSLATAMVVGLSSVSDPASFMAATSMACFTQDHDNASPTPSNPSLPPTSSEVIPAVTPEIASTPENTSTMATSSVHHDHERGQVPSDTNDTLFPPNFHSTVLSRTLSAPVLPYKPVDSIIVASSATQDEPPLPTTLAAKTDVSETSVTPNCVDDSFSPNLTSTLSAAS